MIASSGTDRRYVLTPEEMGECRFVNLGPSPEAVEPLGQRRLLAHVDFVNWLTDPTTPAALKKRARMVSVQILSRGLAANAKPVKGVSAGWMRAGLGGNGGSHFYLWYANGDVALGRSLGLQPGQFLLRLVRPHDDTDQRMPVTNLDDVLEFSPGEILGNPTDVSESPYSDEQRRFAYVASAPVRIVKGYPGSGKTTTLQLAAGTGRARRTLYVTFSADLRRQAREYFDYFTPKDTTVDVFTFAGFLERLNDDYKDSLSIMPPRDAATRLASMEPPNRAVRFGPWEDRFDELYAELHSHGVGRALPFGFRDQPPSSEPYLRPSEFVKRRKADIGKDGAEIASSVLEKISESGNLENLFKSSSMSRRLMEDVNEPMPAGMHTYDAIFVDEVQDFTLVETALLLNVACRLAIARGQMPLMVFAGDESQTVRPTDFDWGELKDLIRAFFPGVDFEDQTLQENMRSSKRVAEMIEASASQYDLLPRRERPGGQSSTSLDHHLEGSVAYCTLENNEELVELLALSAGTGNMRIIHPEARLPPDLESVNTDGLIWLADDAKGLEYDTVVVLDAGRSQRALNEAMSVEGRSRTVGVSLENVWARTAADRFRVSVSRASDTLILVDRDGFDGYEDIESLAERAEIRPPVRVGFTDLEIELRRDSDPLELFNRLSKDLSLLVDRDIEKAIRMAGSGRRRLERALLEDDIPLDVVKRFALACGTVFVYAIVDQLTNESERTEHIREARQLFTFGGMSAEFTDLERLMEVMAGERLESGIAQEAVKSACGARQDLYDRAPDVADILDRMIVRWLRNVLDGDVPRSESEAHSLLGTVRFCKSELVDRSSYVEGLVNAELRKWAESCVTLERFAMGLEVARGLEDMDGLRGRANEALGNFGEAIDSFVAADLVQDAVRCARRSNQLERAIELDDGSDPAVTDALRRLSATLSAVGDGSLHLLSEEQERLFSALNSVIRVNDSG